MGMNLKLRPGTPDDALACGTICYQAFKHISEAHNFPPDFPSPDMKRWFRLGSVTMSTPCVPAIPLRQISTSSAATW